VADFLSVLPATESQYDPKAFCALTSAVVYRRRLDLRYWSASRDEKTRPPFDPYDLALVDDGWYALGHCHLRNDIRMFAIQRVLSWRETGETYDRPADFRGEGYPKGAFGPSEVTELITSSFGSDARSLGGSRNDRGASVHSSSANPSAAGSSGVALEPR
jgi:WYL domain